MLECFGYTVKILIMLANEKVCAERNVKWHHDVLSQGTIWMGGFYERLVQCVKRYVKRTTNDIRPSSTLAEIELILNVRLLGHVCSR